MADCKSADSTAIRSSILQSEICSLHFKLDVHTPVRRGLPAFGIVTVRMPSLRSAVDASDVDRFRQREGAREAAVPALDAMILLAGTSSTAAGARAANHDAAVFGVDVDLIARESGKFRGEDELGRRFVEVDRRRPAGRVGADELPDLLVQREQIAQRIPPREGHVRIVARLVRLERICATIARIYRRSTCRSWHPIPCHRFKRRDSAKACSSRSDNDLFRILELHHLTPGNKRAHIQVADAQHPARWRSPTTSSAPRRTSSARSLDEREMQYLLQRRRPLLLHGYVDLRADPHLARSARRLEGLPDRPNAIIRVEFYDVEPVGIELPPTVDLVVKETAPGIKGATASAQVKPATLETGLVIQVPPFVNEGDKVRVNTETGEYQSRV